MHSDEKTSQLISKSLSGHLAPEQRQLMEQRIAEDARSGQFARISRLIQDSLSDVARRSTDGDDSIAPGLSVDAKKRIRDSIRAESARISHAELGETVTPGPSSAKSTLTTRVRDGLAGDASCSNMMFGFR